MASASPDHSTFSRLSTITLTVDGLVPGGEATFTVVGAAPNEQVHVVRTTQGAGSGPCFGSAGTFCLDLANPIALQGSATSDAMGIATFAQRVPVTAPIGTDVWFQAVIPRGATGLSWVKSAVVQQPIDDAPLTTATMIAGDLVITEVMVDPVQVGDAAGEWIEVHNRSGLDANLEGLTISDGIQGTTLADYTFLASGDFAVFGPQIDPNLNGGVAIDRATPGLSLADQHGEVTLAVGSTVIDTVAWDDGASFPLVAGHSLSLTANIDHIDNDDGSLWCLGQVPYGAGDLGTPGRAGSGCATLVVDLTDADATLTGPVALEYAGTSVASAGDVNGDGFVDVIVGARGDWSTSGTAYVVYGPINGDLDLANADARLIGELQGDAAGQSVAAAGDVNGDGFDDLLVGAPYHPGGSGPGAAYLVHGPVAGDLDLANADAKLIGEVSGGQAGYSVAAAGDVNGDGIGDLLVGDWTADGSGVRRGVAYLVHGPIAGDIDLANADARLIGEADGDAAGSSVASAGDVNGDGFDDLLVGAQYHNNRTGAAYILHGPVVGDVDLANADTRLLGEAVDSWAGYSVASAGDVDGDGLDDVLVGAPDPQGMGTAYLVYAPGPGDIALADADARISGEHSGGLAGHTVAAAGDVNGDGYADVLVSAPYSDGVGTDSGSAYLLYGPLLDDVWLGDASVELVGKAADDTAGTSLCTAGDVDGDGFDDLWVGSPSHDAGGLRAGAVDLIYGASLH